MAKTAMTEAQERAYWAQARRDYAARNDAVMEAYADGWEYCPPQQFYDSLFSGVEFEEPGEMVDWDEPGGGKPNAIVIEITHEKRKLRRKDGSAVDVPVVRRYTLCAGFDVEPLYRRSLDLNDPLYCAPVSYFGKRRTAANARYLHAFAVDLDGVTPQALEYIILNQMRTGWMPQASAIVNSGTGLHLYYFLDEPLPLVPGNVEWLQAMKRALTDRVWNEDTSTIKQRQYQGIFQAFRMPGTTTKLNGRATGAKERARYEAVAFAHVEGGRITRVSPEYLRLKLAPRKDGPLAHPLPEFRPATTPLAEAKKKWPEWYERRVVRGEEPGRWTCKRDLYDWWLAKLRDGESATEGHRYHCVRALKAYGDKCGIDPAEVEADALSLIPAFDAMTTEPANHFTEADVLAALDGDGTRLTRRYIAATTAINIEPNKRNGRPQAQHLKIARFVRDLNYGDGEHWYDGGGRPKGSGTKAALVRSYAAEHPEANHSEIARALGVSRPTVIKWLSQSEHTE